jgi:hypothetical protein
MDIWLRSAVIGRRFGDDGGDLTAELRVRRDRFCRSVRNIGIRRIPDEGGLVCIARNIGRDVAMFGSLTAVVPSSPALARKIKSQS